MRGIFESLLIEKAHKKVSKAESGNEEEEKASKPELIIKAIEGWREERKTKLENLHKKYVSYEAYC